MQKTVSIEGMSCNHCVMAVKKELENISGVKLVDVKLDEKTAIVVLEDNVDNSILEDAVKVDGFEVAIISG